MNWITRKEKSEEHQKLLHDAREIVNTALVEKRDMTTEEETRWTDLHKQAESIYKMVQTLDAQDAAERALEGRQETAERALHGQETSTAEQYRTSWVKWLRYGEKGLSKEDRHHLSNAPAEIRAASNMNTTDAGHGAEWVPTSFANYVTEALKATGGIREAGATVIVQNNGNATKFPTDDDTSNIAVVTSEGSDATDDDTYDPVSSSVTVTPQTWNSKVVRVHINLLNSASFNVEQHVAGLLADRIFRGTNAAFTTGTTGVATKATVGKTGASATAVTYPELIELKHSVNSAYRRKNARWMFNDKTLLYIKQNLLDQNDRPLWNGGNIDLQIPPNVDGDPYTICDEIADLGANALSVLYGSFQYYTIIDVSTMNLVRFGEKYMNALQIGFLTYFQTGGNLINTSAVKSFKNAAS